MNTLAVKESDGKINSRGDSSFWFFVMSNAGSGGKKQLNRNQIFKRQKVRDARTIRAEAVRRDNKQKDNTTNPKGEDGNDLSESGGMLKVAEFVSSRKFELKELQFAMRNSKSANSTRVFQSLPRKLRRRTASHNVKRIPKRMRNRALREMAKNDQNSSTSSANNRGSVLKKPKRRYGLSAAALYRAKMSVKLLRLVGKSASMKLALPHDALLRNKNLRSKIKCLKNQIKDSRNGHRKVTKRNNSMGSYDNTGVNSLASPACNRLKFFKRQRFFTWQPTHIWNAKRSHMIKRWGYQIPWSPTQKCYRMTHRLGGQVASSDGALTLDTSFYGTMIISTLLKEEKGQEKLKALVSETFGKRASLKKFRESHHWFEGHVLDNENDSKNILGPAELLWIDFHNVLVRLHPSIYSNVFQSLVAKYDQSISIQDCRYSLGSITLKGAKSLSALSSILRTPYKSNSYSQFLRLSKVADTTMFPQRTIFAFDCIDARHLGAPRMTNMSISPTIDDVINIQNDFPSDELYCILKKLINPSEREKSYSNQQTLKQLAARRQNLMTEDTDTHSRNLIPHENKIDPSIPLLIIRRPKNNDWVVIMPWFWVLPFWYQLNRVSRVYHMGLRQLQQLSYEMGQLYFPDDYPFTTVGYMENTIYKRDTKKLNWEKKSPGKRVAFDKLSTIHKVTIPSFSGEIGDYFSCDWKLLQILRNGLAFLERHHKLVKICDKNKTTQFDSNGSRAIETLNDLFEFYKDVTDEDSNNDKDAHEGDLPIEIVNVFQAHIKIPDWGNLIQTAINEIPLPVTAVSCTYVGKGHPTDNARIYKIPDEDYEYWKSIGSGIYRADGRKDNDSKQPLPNISDLIGFVTSGSYHFGEGKGIAHGFIDANISSNLLNKHLLIRNVGTNTYRLVEWKFITV